MIKETQAWHVCLSLHFRAFWHLLSSFVFVCQVFAGSEIWEVMGLSRKDSNFFLLIATIAESVWVVSFAWDCAFDTKRSLGAGC